MHKRIVRSRSLPVVLLLLALPILIVSLVACRILTAKAAEALTPVVAAPQRLTNDGDFKQHLQWSPDGKRFLFTRIHAGKMGLWTMNADGSDLKRLWKHDEGPDFDGHWSPDGKRIVLVYDQLQGTDGKLHLYTINADG